MARNWSVAEAAENLPALLDAALTATQYIVDGDKSFRVSVARPERSLEDLLGNEGPLKASDVEDI